VDDLAGRVAVITGAASGIGLAMARRFAGEGMKLVLADIERPVLQRAGEELGRAGADVLTVPTDVSLEAEVTRSPRRPWSTSATCTSSATTPGSGAAACRSRKLPLADFDWVIAVNLFGVIHGLRAFLPHLRANDTGHIVNTASTSGLYHLPRMGPYNASKAAVVALSETLRFELAAEGSRVGVSVLCPSWVRTNISTADRNRPERFAYALDTDQMAQVASTRPGAGSSGRSRPTRRTSLTRCARPSRRTASMSDPPCQPGRVRGPGTTHPGRGRPGRTAGMKESARMTGDAHSELLAEVLSRYEGSTNPRLREITEAAIRHLHAFAEEVDLQRDEWFAGIQFLTATGRCCDDKRQEFILLSDTLGLSSLVEMLTHDGRRGKHREHRARSVLRAGTRRRAPWASRCSSIPTTATGS
jgi:NAD(P)-dependent dehydrogenase (short-subunit alcohol dehydrogenase family)